MAPNTLTGWNWWDDPDNVVEFARYYWDVPKVLVSEILYYFEKPWKWDEQYREWKNQPKEEQ